MPDPMTGFYEGPPRAERVEEGLRIDGVAAQLRHRHAGPTCARILADLGLEPAPPSVASMRHEKLAGLGADLSCEARRAFTDQELVRQPLEHLLRDAHRVE